MSKTLITIGLGLVLLGLLWPLLPPLLQKLHLGRLPGDILIKRDGFRFYFPLTTSILVSILVSIILWIFRR